MKVTVKAVVTREADGRFTAYATEYPGVMAYGSTVDEAIQNVRGLLVKVLEDERDGDDGAPMIPV